MRKLIHLADLQKELMTEFYSLAKAKVIYNKTARKAIWDAEKKGLLDQSVFSQIKSNVPALAHQISRSRIEHHNIQSAVFSECVYAQTFANIFGLRTFINALENDNILTEEMKDFLKSYCLIPRYIYSNSDKSRLLIQAGGCAGVDSALITVIDYKIFTIEFKEPYAKSSEPDLPKYDEDGLLKQTEEFSSNYPQFKSMMEDQKGLNFFEVMGNNIHQFSSDAIANAIRNNYVKKYADVVCTEDCDSYLTMLPINQIDLWAELEGEIRPAGRNAYNVFTPIALQRFLEEKNATIKNGIIILPISAVEPAKERGGNQISRYKINPLFFVRARNCKLNRDFISFNLSDIQQLNPTITAKMNFKNLRYDDVVSHYKQFI